MPRISTLPLDSTGVIRSAQGWGDGNHGSAAAVQLNPDNRYLYYANDFSGTAGTTRVQSPSSLGQGFVIAAEDSLPSGELGISGLGNFLTVYYPTSGVVVTYMHLQRGSITLQGQYAPVSIYDNSGILHEFPVLGVVDSNTDMPIIGSHPDGSHLHIQFGGRVVEFQAGWIADASNGPVIQYETATGRIEPGLVSDDTNIDLASGAGAGLPPNATLLGFVSLNAYGDEANNILTGNSGSNQLNGYGGNDKIYGGDGADNLNGGEGADEIDGGEGADVIGAGGGNDHLFGLAGNDILHGDTGDDGLYGGQGNDLLDGGDGFDVVFYTNGPGPVSIDLRSGMGTDHWGDTDTLMNVEMVFAGDYGDTLLGSNSKNSGDTFWGFNGDDTISGRAGNDTLEGNSGNDSVDGGNGNDRLGGGIFSEDGDDTLDGGADKDTLFGDGGNDILNGGADNDEIHGGANLDILNGGQGLDVLYGGDGSDFLDGGKGNDTISGEGADDIIDASQGDDVIRYSSIIEGHDMIRDFDSKASGGQDVLDLDALFDSLGVEAASRAAHVLVVDNGATVDVSIDTDGSIQNGFELLAVTLETTGSVTVGQDILVGS